jgi:hypothetical protein
VDVSRKQTGLFLEIVDEFRLGPTVVFSPQVLLKLIAQVRSDQSPLKFKPIAGLGDRDSAIAARHDEIQAVYFQRRKSQRVNAMHRHAPRRPQPREGHLEQALHYYAYLKQYNRSSIVFDNTLPHFDETHFVKAYWGETYPDAMDPLLHNMPEPRDNQ